MPTLQDIAKELEKIRAQIPGIQSRIAELRKAKTKAVVPTEPLEGETRINPQTGQTEVYRPWGEWTSLPTKEDIAKYPSPLDVAGSITSAAPLETTKTTSFYDIGKIQADLTEASTKKRKAYEDLIGLQQRTYETEYEKAGIGKIRDEIAKIDKEIADRKARRDQALLDEKGKPIPQWMITGRKALEIEAATNDINRLIDERNNMARQYNASLDDVVRRVGYATTDAQTRYSFWESEERRLSDFVKNYQAELTRQLEKAEKAPSIIGTAETGYYQWDPTERRFKMIIPPTPEKVTKKSLQAIKDPITGKTIGYFDPETGESHYYEPEEKGTPTGESAGIKWFKEADVRTRVSELLNEGKSPEEIKTIMANIKMSDSTKTVDMIVDEVARKRRRRTLGEWIKAATERIISPFRRP